ncbi:hypothetical protein [Mesorhizobium delmotii]|uniref:hypothetical protein n=1 Tax=Mesorhizobium delmotii TaxID=1631247 RepID=UPI000F439397|nr:hypothetical protein [Mesorhizobium delmotii]
MFADLSKHADAKSSATATMASSLAGEEWLLHAGKNDIMDVFANRRRCQQGTMAKPAVTALI